MITTRQQYYLTLSVIFVIFAIILYMFYVNRYMQTEYYSPLSDKIYNNTTDYPNCIDQIALNSASDNCSQNIDWSISRSPGYDGTFEDNFWCNDSPRMKLVSNDIPCDK